MFKKILIANRGEIAVRIIKACKEMNITAVAVYSDADINSLHVREADEAYHIGKSAASESYLDYEKIIALAKRINAEAIHPGYGFLSENANFIREVEKAGITFIGPSADTVDLMGEKTSARTLMKKNNVPIVPGTTEPITSLEEAKKIAEEIGFPIMIKASAGGGGKGMRKVSKLAELEEAIERAQNESQKAFSSSEVYMEKFIEQPKHIEVQILGDKHGNYIHLFERECSVQRRHQKVLEEAPSSSIDSATREQITKAAINAAKACNYYNAGTIEFLYDNKNFYFLEMNTRLQVEHPVTEFITGVDIVKEQIKIAYGEKLSFTQKDIKLNGHAIECRIYAEDVDNNFAPSIGKILHYRTPTGPGVRVDSGIEIQTEVSIFYDPMLAKLVVWDKDRNNAIARMKRALSEYQIGGVKTNINFFYWILEHKYFLDSSFDNNFLENNFLPLTPNKWRENNNGNYEKAVAILGAYLTEQENKIHPVKLENNNLNKWESLKYE